jgi:hypothetical protein
MKRYKLSQIKLFFQKILLMNYPGGSDTHQYHIESILNETGFKRSLSVFSISYKERDEALVTGNINFLQNSEYVSQPCGTQDSPDFIIKYNDKLYFIECKSSKGTKPTYNGGIPKKQYIYIFSSEKYNSTTIFRGEDILPDSKRELFENLRLEEIALVKKYQNNPNWNDSRGFDYYPRAMYTQSGTWDKTDYFRHKDRKVCEENILNFL